MLNRNLRWALLAVLPVASATAQVPPGYEIVQVTSSPYYDAVPRVNESGQLVFTRWYDISDHSTQEIFLYTANIRHLVCSARIYAASCSVESCRRRRAMVMTRSP